jgi:hypothetical protein
MIPELRFLRSGRAADQFQGRLEALAGVGEAAFMSCEDSDSSE